MRNKFSGLCIPKRPGCIWQWILTFSSILPNTGPGFQLPIPFEHLCRQSTSWATQKLQLKRLAVRECTTAELESFIENYFPNFLRSMGFTRLSMNWARQIFSTAVSPSCMPAHQCTAKRKDPVNFGPYVSFLNYLWWNSFKLVLLINLSKQNSISNVIVVDLEHV